MLWTKLFTFILSISIYSGSCLNTTPDYDWQKYKETFNKRYSSDLEEEMRKSYFIENLEKIAEHNRHYDLQLTTFTLGLNEFSDMSDSEFESRLLTLKMTVTGRSINEVFSRTDIDDTRLPRKIDWRGRGVVTRVKEQGACGAYWAFATIAAVESAHALETGNLVALSEQQLIDCSKNDGNNGCNGGGETDASFKYIIDNGGINTEQSYPFIGKDDTCKFDPKNNGATITKYVEIKKNDEGALLEAVASKGPVAVSINGKHLKDWKDGILNDPECDDSELNHMLLVVGYGDKDGLDYWIAKNSWGLGWGKEGYIYLARNRNNQCGIASHAFYPVV